MLAATIMPFLISNYLSSKIIENAVQEQLVDLNQQSMTITMSSIHNYIHDVSMLAHSYYGDADLIRLLSKKEIQTPAETVYINQKLEKIYVSYHGIGSISYKSALTNKQFNVKSELNKRVTIPDFYNETLETDRAEFMQDYSAVMINGERRLQINKYHIDIATQNIIGMTTLTLKDSALSELAATLMPTKDSNVFILLHDDLQLLSSSAMENDTTDWIAAMAEKIKETNNESKGMITDSKGIYIYYKTTAHNLPITLVKFIPQHIIDLAGKKALNQSLTIQIVMLVFVGIMAGVISYYILTRVQRILQQIKRIKMGNFNVDHSSKSMDEFGILEDRFQSMISELDELWNQQYRYQLEVSNSKLKVLQAQINPHFLYNTLQSISTLAIKKNVHEVSDRLAELGAMFRYSMNIEEEEVHIQHELEHLNHYISLQQGRFKNKLQFIQSCDDEALSMMIPKMVFQPLVENSIVHGIEKGSGSGLVKVEIELREQLIIRLIDNGCGFSEGKISDIRNQYLAAGPSKDSQLGIGLINVLKRLQLYYGDDFEWNITSEPFVETMVTLMIPISTQKGATIR